jgi:hypothetical protein
MLGLMASTATPQEKRAGDARTPTASTTPKR